MNILVVDNDRGIRDYLRLFLGEQGHTVAEAGNGQDGLAKVGERRPDAIICDGLMPVMDGFQFLQALKRDFHLSSIPFIFLTSVSMGQHERELAMCLGADAFLVKPQPPQAIVDALRAVNASVKAPFLDEKGAVTRTTGTAREITERTRLSDELRAALARAEDEKVKSESIIRAIGDGVTIQGADYRILYQNEASRSLMGDHIGDLCYEVYERREQRCEECPVAMVFEDGGTHTVERSVPTDKETLFFELTASPLRDSKGKITAGIEVAHNITERKKRNEALRASEERYRLLFQNSPVGIFHYNADLIITDSNERFAEILKTKREQVIGMNIRTLKDQRVLPSLEAVLSGKEGRYEGAYNATTSSAEIWVSMSTAPILDQDSAVTSGVGIVEDITDRKKLEGKIFQKEQDWAFTFNSITDMVTVHDKDWNIILANKAAEKILGLPLLEKAKDPKCFQYYHGKESPPEGCPSCSCLQTGMPAVSRFSNPI